MAEGRLGKPCAEKARRGRISYGELSRRRDVGQVDDTNISYMGFATRSDSAA